MPKLDFEIISAEVRPEAAHPTLVFKILITNATENEEIYAAALRCQVMIEAVHRQYDEASHERLLEAFGERHRMDGAAGARPWAFITLSIPRFTGQTLVEVPISCSDDQAMAAGKYLYTLRKGTVPFSFLFSGTVFYQAASNGVHVMQVPWNVEADFQMPVALWQQMMDSYFPNSRWLRMRKDFFDKLYRYNALNAFPTLENCLETIVEQALEKTQYPEKETL